MVSEGRIDWTVAHLGLECLISHRLFVLDVRSAQLVVIVMADNVTCENSEFNAGSIDELIHGRECRESEIRWRVTIEVPEFRRRDRCIGHSRTQIRVGSVRTTA